MCVQAGIAGPRVQITYPYYIIYLWNRDTIEAEVSLIAVAYYVDPRVDNNIMVLYREKKKSQIMEMLRNDDVWRTLYNNNMR